MWCVIILCYIILLESVPCFALSKLLIGFRPPSRNTWGFSDSSSYTLPHDELLACLPTECAQLIPFTHCCQSTDQVWELKGVSKSEAVKAVKRAVLSHSLFEVLGASDSLDAALEAAATAAAVMIDAKNDTLKKLGWFAAATPSCGVDVELQSLHPGNVEICRRTELWKDTVMRKGARASQNDVLIEIFDGMKLSSSPTVALLYIMARRIAIGPAVDRGGVLASNLKRRRPRAGWLNTLALHKRNGRCATSMEPEIAFLMANLAAVSSSPSSTPSLVLDPFAGSASILLAAAYIARFNGCCVKTFGVDAAAFVKQPDLKRDIKNDWTRLALPPPLLVTGTIVEWSTWSFLNHASYDAIITDPPYAIKEEPLVYQLGTRKNKAAYNLDEIYRKDDVRSLYAALFDLAASLLRENGRLVVFVPEPFSNNTACNKRKEPELLGLTLPSPLKLIYISRQRFRGGTFSRSLVVIKKSQEFKFEPSKDAIQ